MSGIDKIKKIIIFLRSGKTVVITNPQIYTPEEVEERFTQKLESERKCVYIKNIDSKRVNELHLFFLEEIAGVTISSFG